MQEKLEAKVLSGPLLWERWSGREHNTSPFGICLRPSDPQNTGPHLPAWEYRPAYLSDRLLMTAARGDREEALVWLRRAVEVGNHNYPWFQRDKNYDKLRADPEYQRIMEGVRQHWQEYRQIFGEA